MLTLWLSLGRLVMALGRLVLCAACPCGSGSGSGSGGGGAGPADGRPDPGPVDSSCCRPVLMPGVAFLTISGSPCACMNGTFRMVYAGFIGGFDEWFSLYFDCTGAQARWRLFCDLQLHLVFECPGVGFGFSPSATFHWTCSPFATTDVEPGSLDADTAACCPTDTPFFWSVSP